MAETSAYPGSPSLSPEAREKVLQTFRHTLELAKNGRNDEALLGCDFILKMDSRFSPARRLLEKLRGVAAGTVIDTSEFEEIVASVPVKAVKGIAGTSTVISAPRPPQKPGAPAQPPAASAVPLVPPAPPSPPQEITGFDFGATPAPPQSPGAAPAMADPFSAAFQPVPSPAGFEDFPLGPPPGAAPDPFAAPPVSSRAPMAAPQPPQPAFGDFGSFGPPPAQDDWASQPPPAAAPAPGGYPEFGSFGPPPAPAQDDWASQPPPAAPGGYAEFGSFGPPPAPAQDDWASQPPPAAPAPGGFGDFGSFGPPPAPAQDDWASQPPPAAPAPGGFGDFGSFGPPPAPAQDDWASQPPPAAPAPGGFGDFGSFGPPPATDFGSFGPEPAPGGLAGPGAFASPDLGPAPGSAPDPFASFGAVPSAPSPVPPSASVDPRITQFLKQGDEAMSRGQIQEAIDLWSRVYLIDLSNDDATRRIDQARERQAAAAQRVDMLVSEGMQAYERGEMEVARAKFLEVQSLSPNDAAAQSYLSQIEAALSSAPSPFEAGSGPEAPPAREEPQYAEEASWQPQGESLEIPSEEVAEPKRAELPKKAFKIDQRILIGVGAAAVLLLAVGGFFIFGPKSKTVETPPPVTKKGPERPVGEDLLGKAQGLFEQGRVDEALQILVGIPDTDPRHADALIMIDRFKTTAIPTPPAAVSSENLDELKAKGMAAIRDSRYLDAVKSLDPFVKARPDDSEAALALARAREELSALAPALKAYNEQDYATAVKLLWPLYSKDKKNKDMEEFLFRAFFNEGIQKMQAGDFTESYEAFKSASAIRAQDSDLQRHMRFTKKYPQGPTDLMARIYVKHAAPKL